MKKESTDIKLYGVASCLELLKRRPKAVLRLFIRQELKEDFAPFKIPYKIVSNQELERLTDSVHHEGVCVCVAKSAPKFLSDHLPSLKKKGCLLFLDHPLNPHNLGAIVRSAGHFNVLTILSPVGAGLPPSGFRVAKGGAEYVDILHYKDKKEALQTLKKLGYQIYATSPHNGLPLKKLTFAPQSVIILGGESKGASSDAISLADELITINGSGKVESLNVSNAFCLLASHYYTEYS
jgi:TrmH RNA methyltransferase